MKVDKSKIHFYLSRFKRASFPEIAYRLRHLWFLYTLRRKLANKEGHGDIPSGNKENINSLKLPLLHIIENGNTAREILNGKVFTLNADLSELKAFGGSNRHIFFDDIEYTGYKPDIRQIWEPARLQHLTILLSHIRKVQEANGADTVEPVKAFVKDRVLQWLSENPFPYGPHYISAMECGLRIPMFFYCIKNLDNLSNAESSIVLQGIYQHAWWISKRLSLYSSLGNHTIAEAAGLIFAGSIFRDKAEGRQFLARGIHLLEQERSHQVFDDGGPAEQSFGYLRFVLDLYWLCIDFLEKNNLHDCVDLKAGLMSGEEFLNAFALHDGKNPAIGDSDDGCAIAPGTAPERVKVKSEHAAVKSFPASGYTAFRTKTGCLLSFDHGPLGMAPLYNHGHADALSVTLSKHGKEILVDPGTYRYNDVQEWRSYFKGTRAHNTVTIDGYDQAVQETGFIWSHPYSTQVRRSYEKDDVFFIEAEHNGYSRLNKPVTHRRMIICLDTTDLVIKDTFHGEGTHSYELNFHLHPDAKITKEPGWWSIQKEDARIFLALLDGDDFEIIRGKEKPIMGWYSRAYGIKEESGTLSLTKKGPPGEISFVTAICTGSLKEKEELKSMIFKYA